MKPSAVAAALYAAITLVFVAPLLSHFTTAYPHDSADPALNTWILWWSSRALPLTGAWWDAPMFFPMRGALALSEVLIGLLPITLPVQWLTHNPLIAYNVAFVLTFPLCALAMYALAFEITGDRTAAFLAGLSFAFAPYRMSQLAHLQMLAYYGAPLALVALHRFARTRSRMWLVLFGGAWLVQSLSNGYAMFHLAVLLALWLAWFARDRRLAVPIVIAWAAASVPLLPVLLRYDAVHSALHLTRNINEIRGFGLDIADFATTAPEVATWGRILPIPRPETAVFPGATLLIVGLIALVARSKARRREAGGFTRDRQLFGAVALVAGAVALSWALFGSWRLGPLTVNEARKPLSIAILALVWVAVRGPWFRGALRRRSIAGFYLVAMIAMYVLAFGPEPRAFGWPFLYRPPYDWLMALPGFSTLRVPARFAALASACAAVLLAVVVARWRARASRGPVLAGVIAAGLLCDGAVGLPVAPAPAQGPAWSGVDAVLELPESEAADFAAIHRATGHGMPIVNGYSGYFPNHYLPLRYALTQDRLEVLQAFPAPQGIGVAIDLHQPESAAIVAHVAGLPGARRREDAAGWATFVVPGHLPALPTFGPSLPIAHLTVNRMLEESGRMLDGRVETGWHAGPSQAGNEEVVADLGSAREVGGVDLTMAAFAFGFPRALDVDTSLDGVSWTRAWSGPTDRLVVQGALADPGNVPLRIGIDRQSARYVRLRQTGAWEFAPWWIAELAVHAPLGP